MNTRFVKRTSFQVAGLAVHDGVNSNFTGIWADLFAKFTMEELSGLGSGEYFGLCYDFKTADQFSYMAGYDVLDIPRAQQLGLEILAVPEAEYLVLSLQGPMPQCIQAGWDYLRETYFPQNPLQHDGTPDFEVYFAGDPTALDYQMELWVPVVEKK